MEWDLTKIQFTHTGAVRALLTMGVFDELPVNGDSRTAQQLSDALKVEKQLLGKTKKMQTVVLLGHEIS